MHTPLYLFSHFSSGQELSGRVTLFLAIHVPGSVGSASIFFQFLNLLVSLSGRSCLCFPFNDIVADGTIYMISINFSCSSNISPLNFFPTEKFLFQLPSCDFVLLLISHPGFLVSSFLFCLCLGMFFFLSI
jgi:hypothetical protein